MIILDTIRQAIARTLRNRICELQDFCFELADRIDPDGPMIAPPSVIETGLMIVSTAAEVDMKRRHPCPECNGKGALAIHGDDPVACLTCHGLGVDPAALFEASVRR